MATSGSRNFSLNRNQIITNALGLLKVVGAEDTVSSADMATSSQFLNMMIKLWEADGIGLWAQTEATLFLTASDGQYTLGGSSSDRIANTVVETTTSASASSGASSITVTSATGMTASDNIGIVLDSDSIQWTTISSIASTTITLATTLTADVASGNRVYTYTSTISRPHDVSQVRYRDDGDIDRELTQYSREEYFSIPNKNTDSIPLAYYYSPQLSGGELYLWPRPSTVNGRIKLTYVQTLQDFDASTDDADFPVEWLLALTYNLAVCLAPLYGKDSLVSQGLGQQADYYLRICKSFDHDTGPLYMVPDLRR